MKKRWLHLLIAVMLLSIPLLSACEEIEIPEQLSRYTVFFDTDTDEIPNAERNYLEGHEVPAPFFLIMERAGDYVFDGWYLGNTLFEFGTPMPAHNITLKARWILPFRITFDSDGGTPVQEIKQVAGTPIFAPPPPTKIIEHQAPQKNEYWKFVNWVDESGNLFAWTQMPSHNVVLKAVWDRAFAIVFDTGGGSAVDPIIAVKGETVSAPVQHPVREGFHFGGWFKGTDEMDARTPFNFDSMPEEDVTAYAKWHVASILPVLIIDLDNFHTIDQVHSTYAQNNQNQANVQAYYRAVIGYGDRDTGITFVPGQFRARGHGSFNNSSMKKQYRIRFDSRQELFGMPASRHFVTIAGVHGDVDRSMLQYVSALAFSRHLVERDNFGMESAMRTEAAVDMYINGVYWGVHNLSEHIRVDEQRVDIPQSHGFTAAQHAQSGYLMNIAVWGGHYDNTRQWERFTTGLDNWEGMYVLKAPDGDDAFDASLNNLPPNERVYVNGQLVTSATYGAQRDWIKARTAEALTLLDGTNWASVSARFNINSFIDSYIVHELWRKYDPAGGYHIYTRPNGNTPTFYAGPAWDFKYALNASYNASLISSSSSGYFNLFRRLRTFTQFNQALNARWAAIFNETKQFITDYFNQFIDNQEYIYAFSRNVQAWNTVWTGSAANWNESAKTDRDWLIARADWLNQAGTFRTA
ncbi:MAG: InlB B-repeat-containing protein [Firmicutes bacterium]|nr:InlB B-repeat-containing protein [Bacillota bacterium]